MKYKINRRTILKLFGLLWIFLIRPSTIFGSNLVKKEVHITDRIEGKTSRRFGVDRDGYSRVYLSCGGNPEQNIKKSVFLYGGIDKIVNTDDIVIIKPNAQWWHQGTSNTNMLKGLIEEILGIPNFSGEIIIAENHHYKIKNSRGWTTKKKNGEFNLNQLVEYFHQLGDFNVTKYHWVDAGPNPNPQEGDASGINVVKPFDGKDGYVWLNDVVYKSKEDRQCIMTYPIFTSSYSGKQIDLMNGVISGDNFINKVKLINFSCLNHHSSSWGLTGSIKNLMGIVDMTCGYHGTEPEGYYNTHFIGNKSKIYDFGTSVWWHFQSKGLSGKLGTIIQRMGSFNTQYTGGALGYWMRKVRMPDINIIAAEYVGWGGRINLEKRKHVKTVALSKDPVALDKICAEKILLRATPKSEKQLRNLNDPNKRPFKKFLQECYEQGIGNIEKNKIKIIM